MEDFRGIGQSGEDIRRCELWILRHDLLRREAIRQASHDHPHRNARTSNAGFPVVDLRIYAHSLLPRGTFHASSLLYRLGFGTEGAWRGSGAMPV